MRDEGNVVIGFLGKCDFDLGIAVVNITTFLDVQVVLLNHLMVFLPYSKVVAVGRGISGKLMATSGMLTLMQADLKIVKILCYPLVKSLR